MADTKVQFGLASYKGAITGLQLTSVTYGESASTNEPINEDGNINQIDVYGKKKTIQCEGNVVVGGSIEALTVGGTVKVGAITYTITSVSVKESPNGSKTCSISGEAPFEAAV